MIALGALLVDVFGGRWELAFERPEAGSHHSLVLGWHGSVNHVMADASAQYPCFQLSTKTLKFFDS